MLTQLVFGAAAVVLLIIIAGIYFAFRREDEAEVHLADSIASGMNLPPSLHPVIDLTVCMGSSACLDSCPAHVLGRVAGVTQMIEANECIGHGRCKDSCPVDAISLVFGTAERGVDIPLLRKGHETNVNGIMIVGELGGMGLIRNAFRQGITAVGTIPKILGRENVAQAQGEVADVVIVGGGPAGVAAALECKRRDLSFVVLEQFSTGGSVTHYPRRKLIFTETIKLPIVGNFGKSEMFKEELVNAFDRVVDQAGIEIREGRRVTAIDGRAGDFRLKVELLEGGAEEYRGRTVILAIGRRGTPRRLDVPGEDQSHVVYRLIDAEQYRRRKVLVVGGGDVAVESAVSVSKAAGATVHLSYRGEALFRAKKENRRGFEEQVKKGKIKTHFKTNVARLTRDTAVLRHDDGREQTIEVDDVIVNVGGVLPTAFLEQVGIRVETKYGEGPSKRAAGSS